jgi:cytochrome c oxidase assembly protein subunit 15
MVIVKLHLHPLAVAPHFLISIALVVVSAVLLARVYDGDGTARVVVPRPLLALGFAIGAVAAAVLLLGTITTSSGPHSGDIDATLRLGFDPRTVSWLHADSVMLFCGLLVGLLLSLYLLHSDRRTIRGAWLLVAVTALQALIGYTQYFTGLPEVLVGAHMAGAALFTAAVTWLITRMYRFTEPVEVTAEGDAARPSAARDLEAETR